MNIAWRHRISTGAQQYPCSPFRSIRARSSLPHRTAASGTPATARRCGLARMLVPVTLRKCICPRQGHTAAGWRCAAGHQEYRSILDR